MEGLSRWQSRRLMREVLARVANPDRFPPLPPREPECRFAVRLSDDAVCCERPDGQTERIAWDDLRRVEIVTTDEGPFLEDVFWVLTAADGGCLTIPQGAGGDNTAALLERLGPRLPGFDHEAVIRAMGSTENARFLCWQRAT